jgi:para-aminobenzoate synthetase component 1
MEPTSSTLGAPFAVEVAGLTPRDVWRRLANERHVVFFDSASVSPLGRFSYVSADPLVWLESSAGQTRRNGVAIPAVEPFHALRELLAPHRLESRFDLPPFQGGVAGLFGYGLAHHLETLPRPTFDDFRVPDLAVGLYDWVFAFDHARGKAWVIATGLPETTDGRRQARARQRLDEVRRRLERSQLSPWTSVPPIALATPQYPVPGRERLTSNFDRPGYLHMLRRGIEYIHAGDCFQVNLAQRLTHPLAAPPFEIYDRLRTRNAAPFAGYLDLGDFVLASASPERFLKLTDGEVETRPIKGTRPRGVYPMEDMARGDDLLESLKDRAENVMIVDLLRNDLGRVCAYGSIRVSQVCQLETFPFVHHLVSEVRGRLRPGKDAVDLLKATFPGGSVTGAPKIRAMEIITELERVARGPYCGCLGFIGFDGGMDTNLLIRTMVLGKGWIQFSVGGGIVADSVPEREYEETWHKAAGILRALEE